MTMRTTARLFPNWKHALTAAFLVFGIALFAFTAQAANLPLATDSKVAGINFGDKPFLLPVQRNFQMAMLVASSELGRSCGKMEAFGWQMDAKEQARVNQIFNDTVDSMRSQGYVVEAKAPASVARDVTLFTADRTDKHVLFMWSAGEVGLVLVACETSAPLPATRTAVPTEASAPVATGPFVEANKAPPSAASKTASKNFSPVGSWIGTYTCAQGTTGGTLRITREHGGQVDGVFRFYPTVKNPYVPSGSYQVFGDYDADSQRILLNPGKWLQKPENYAATILIGSFDPLTKTFSAYFQGVNGCTSFEASYNPTAGSDEDVPAPVKKKPVKKAKKAKIAKDAKPKESAKDTQNSKAEALPPASPSSASAPPESPSSAPAAAPLAPTPLTFPAAPASAPAAAPVALTPQPALQPAPSTPSPAVPVAAPAAPAAPAASAPTVPATKTTP